MDCSCACGRVFGGHDDHVNTAPSAVVLKSRQVCGRPREILAMQANRLLVLRHRRAQPHDLRG